MLHQILIMYNFSYMFLPFAEYYFKYGAACYFSIKSPAWKVMKNNFNRIPIASYTNLYRAYMITNRRYVCRDWRVITAKFPYQIPQFINYDVK